MTWVKICATTNLEDAQIAVDAGADALGFIFAPSSRRVSPRDVAKITAQLPPAVEKIGVFINQRTSIIVDTVREAGLTGVQLHGTEELAAARELRKQAEAGGRKSLRIIKGLHARELMPDQPGGEYGLTFVRGGSGVIDGLLLDSGTPERRGGTGRTFDWDEAAPMVTLLGRKEKVIIAGGLNPENVSRALRLFSPWGIDVVTGVEREPGKKDRQKVKAFIAAVRAAEGK